MYKNVVALAFCGAVIGIAFYYFQTQKLSPLIDEKKIKKEKIGIPTKTVNTYKQTSGIFIPYWQIPSDPAEEVYKNYTELYYFGISANSNGVSTSEPGYLKLDSFIQSAHDKDIYLTLRMLDTDENLTVLADTQIQKKIIQQTLELVQKYNFKGVVLDFELGVLPFSSTVEKINSFSTDFYLSAKQNNMVFMQMIYGDVFYKKRPFDVSFLAQHADRILVMAYDFHKANGDPGPNFPFSGREKFGYDFQKMTEDFLSTVPKDKLTFVFGMYGYDWITDMKGTSLRTAKSISSKEIQAEYIDKCDWKNCVILRDPKAGEVEINYVDSTTSPELIYHTIWFEDETSVRMKSEYLKKKGIGSTAFWAYSYF